MVGILFVDFVLFKELLWFFLGLGLWRMLGWLLWFNVGLVCCVGVRCVGVCWYIVWNRLVLLLWVGLVKGGRLCGVY